MYSCVCPRCGGNKYPDAAADEEKLSDLFGPDIKRICAQLYSGKLQAGNIDLKSARKVATVISQAILKGFGKEFPKLDFDTPDFEMYSHIEKQVWHFSFAKNYEQLKAASLALQTGNQVTPWGEFKSIVERINGDYNVRNLKTEYDTGIGSAQMAARWVQYIADEVKLLKYQTVGDSRVRPSHQELDGIIRKITDAFWSLYYPPNGWRCRCDAIDAGNAKETPQSKIVTPTDVPPMFKRNLAKEGLAFPPDHPYFEHVPDDILQAADNNNPFIYDRHYSSDKGGSVWVSNLHGAGELKDNLAIAKFYADRGDMVTLMPNIDIQSPQQQVLRKMALPDKVAKSNKNPDALINGRTVEFKTGKEGTANSLRRLVRTGLKQADDVAINLIKDMQPANIKKAIADQLEQSYGNNREALKGRTLTVFREGKPTVYKLDKLARSAKALPKPKAPLTTIIEEKSYKIINAEADKIIKNQIEKLRNEYPKSTLNTFYGTKRKTIAECSLGKFMGFNPKYFNNLDYFERTIKTSIDTGYLHKATSINGIIDHEFGHILTSNALPINVKGETPFKTELSKIFDNYRKALNDGTKKGIKWAENPDFISKYSHTNLREFAAESFSYARADKKASPYAKEVLTLINKYFK